MGEVPREPRTNRFDGVQRRDRWFAPVIGRQLRRLCPGKRTLLGVHPTEYPDLYPQDRVILDVPLRRSRAKWQSRIPELTPCNTRITPIAANTRGATKGHRVPCVTRAKRHSAANYGLPGRLCIQ